jgi:Tfp pilus assembly protein PilN
MRFNFLRDPAPAFALDVRSWRLPRRLYVQAVIGVTLIGAIAALGGIDALRLRSAAQIERRAQLRFDATRDELAAARLRWQQLDDLMARDRRLRALHLSGAGIAVRIARVGNAFPPGTWATTLSADSNGFAFKGRAEDVRAASTALAKVLDDRRLQRHDAQFRLSRDGDEEGAPLAFEIRAEPNP